MNDPLYWPLFYIVEFVLVFAAFAVLSYIGKFLFDKIKSCSFFKKSKYFNPTEYLPEEQLPSINQVFYLIMILIIVMCIFYIFFTWRGLTINRLLFDVILSIYLAIQSRGSSWKNRLIFFCLIPFGSLTTLLFGPSLMSLLDIIHIIGYMYFIKYYYNRFVEYTVDNRLGITIILLFSIIFISFIFTMAVEDVSPIDSLVMVSNAFTSNGYAVLGKTGLGKVNALFLVWSGFLLSAVGTATLTVAIVKRHFDQKFDSLEDSLKRNRKN